MKQSSLTEKEIFANEVILLFNPKFENIVIKTDEYGKEMTDFDIAQNQIIQYFNTCDLTFLEFMSAMRLASKGHLIGIDEKPIKMFREIDALKFGEVENAYLEYKRIDKQYDIGMSKIKAFLESPKPEPTPEEMKQSFLEMCKADYVRLQKEGYVLGATEYYKYIKKNGIENVKISWIENVLEKFQPETFDGSLSVSKVGSMLEVPKKIKHDVKLFFIENLVKAYFKKEDLKELSEEKFLEYWENIYEKSREKK